MKFTTQYRGRILQLVSELNNLREYLMRINIICFLIFATLTTMLAPRVSNATGISVDAGLNPSEGRWMVRTMLHTMYRGGDTTPMGRSMDTYRFNAVLAYGLRRNLTVILKQPTVHQEMTMAGTTSENTGISELSMMTKYGIYRRNTRDYTLGVATTLGLKLPTGATTFSSRAYDLNVGIYTSIRTGTWSSDFNIAFGLNSFVKKNDDVVDVGAEFTLDWALAYQFNIGQSANLTLTPLLEVSYKNIASNQLNSKDLTDSGEKLFFLSPGLKFVKSSVITEVLVQIPVSQSQNGNLLERETGFIVGIRYMF